MLKRLILFLTVMVFCKTMINAGDFSLGIDAPQVEKNKYRQRICLNGLWRFYPLSDKDIINDNVPKPGTGWGYFKVPGVWPEHKSPSSPFVPLLNKEDYSDPAKWHTAWYSRWIETPVSCEGKKVILDIGIIQTRGVVYVDEKKVGEIIFPGGRLDITKFIKPTRRQKLDIRVSAIPLSAGHYIVMDGNNVSAVAAKVKNKGITSDVFLDIVPLCRIERTHYITSFRKKQITFASEISGLENEKKYSIKAAIMDRGGNNVKVFTSDDFTKQEYENGKAKLTFDWIDPLLWDVNTPQNMYTAVLTLIENGQEVDRTIGEKFGFREYWIDGQNYVLNGKVIHLRAYHLENYSASWSPDRASKEWAFKAYARLKDLGFNFTISRNYNFAEGAVNYLEGSFAAADEVGHLHSMSLPHPWQFDPLTDDTKAQKFDAMCKYLIKRYWNHPSLVMYVTNHNYAGAWGDQSPLRVGGEYKRANNPEEVEYKEKGRTNFIIAQKLIASIDPTRPTYSHASGSLGGQYSLNMYLNWAPIQERSDWLENFYENGKYPLSLVEWGLPHNASFSSYRGPKFIWSTKDVMTFWDAEYCALLYGDDAARWNKERLRLLDLLVKIGNKKINWGEINSVGSRLPQVIQLQGDFFKDNLRSLRAWNVAMILPWDSYAFFKKNKGKFPPVENKNRYKNLNSPGMVPDFSSWGNYILSPYENQYSLSYLGEVIKKWNQPLIAWIGGENVFTSKEHIYSPGAKVKKQLIVVNDEREDLTCEFSFWVKGCNIKPNYGKVLVRAGTRVQQKVELDLNEKMKPGTYNLSAEFKFSNGRKLADTFEISVISSGKTLQANKEDIALYSIDKQTSTLLSKLDVPFTIVDATSDLSKYHLLIIGRNALANPQKLPDLAKVKDGLNVLILEQNTAIIKRLGFRYQEYGLRRLFKRNANHYILKNMENECLRDWRGESTLTSPYLDYNQFYCPKWNWCGFENTRVWRARNRGNVASVLIEKPTTGNFSPILDGGFALQYAPLLEYTEGQGRVLISQIDSSARTSNEPAANNYILNCISYLLSAKVPEYKTVKIISNSLFKKEISKYHLQNIVEDINSAQVIILGPGGDNYPDLTGFVNSGKTVVMLGLNSKQARDVLPGEKFTDLKSQASQYADLSDPFFSSISNLDTAFQIRLDYAVHEGRELSSKSIGKGKLIFSGVIPEMLNSAEFPRLRSNYRRRAFLVGQLFRNCGIGSSSDFILKLNGKLDENSWLSSYYLQMPVSSDDPYRYYHW